MARIVSGGIPFLPMVAFSVVKDASQSIPASTLTKLTWQTEVYDFGAGLDLANDKFVAPEDGPYHFDAAARFEFNTQEVREVLIMFTKNDVEIKRGAMSMSGDAIAADNWVYGSVHVDLNLLQGDEVDVRVDHGEAGARNINSTAGTTYWMGHKLR